MNRFKRIICLLLMAVVLAQITALPASALINFPLRDAILIPHLPAVAEDVRKIIQQKGEQTTPEETLLVETAPAETVPEETAPVETVPEETVPEETVPEATEPATYDEVPLYFQTDYPDVIYAYDTVATSGCSMASLAMVATYLTDHKYTPDQLADWFGGWSGSHVDRLEYASEQMQLPYEKAITVHDALRALKEGKVVIALMSKNSLFTDGQHFIVLAGMTVDGKILVNDPYEPNYTHWQLSVGFENGFEESQVTWGFGGGWIYDKNQIPANPYIYEPKEWPVVPCRYPGVELSKEDMRLFAKLLWLEARGETYEGQRAVAEVILNRLVSDKFPDTIRGIVYAEGQFPCTDDIPEATPSQTQYEAIERALKGPYVLPMEVVFYAKYKENKNFWGKIGAHYFCYGYDWKPEATEPTE